MSDGREEREETQRRLERENQERRDDRVDEGVDEWEPERISSLSVVQISLAGRPYFAAVFFFAAHRAFCAAAIFRFVAALKGLRLVGAGAVSIPTTRLNGGRPLRFAVGIPSIKASACCRRA
jgi:hypothetical protein